MSWRLIYVISSESGIVLQQQRFTAFGERREVAGNKAIPATGSEHTYTNKGYTGHEMLDKVGLVHMNGRLYDAELGRFISADPFVSGLGALSLNRYSYVNNNPLSFTDPSGYFLKQLGRFFQRTMNSVASYASSFAKEAIIAGAGPVLGPWMASLMAYAETGDFRSALVSAFTTYFTGQLGGASDFGAEGVAKAFAHGIVQGAGSQLQGGSFRDGFLGAFAAQALHTTRIAEKLGMTKAAPGDIAQRMKNALIAAGIGGTAAKLGNGKFGNGAASAAAVQMFNADNHPATNENTAFVEVTLRDMITIGYNSNDDFALNFESDLGFSVNILNPSEFTVSQGKFDWSFKGKKLNGLGLNIFSKKLISGSLSASYSDNSMNVLGALTFNNPKLSIKAGGQVTIPIDEVINRDNFISRTARSIKYSGQRRTDKAIDEIYR